MAPFLQTSQLSGCNHLDAFVQQLEQTSLQRNLQRSPRNLDNGVSQQPVTIRSAAQQCEMLFGTATTES